MTVSLAEMKDTFLGLREKRYTALRTRQLEHDKLYWCDLKPLDVGLSGSAWSSLVIMPWARMFVESPVNHIAMDTIEIKQRALSHGIEGLIPERAQRQADKNERWCRALLAKEAMQPPYFLREIVKNLAHRGEAYIKREVKPGMEVWGALAENGQYEGNPFSIEVPDARQVYSTLDMQENGEPYILFYVKTMTVRHLRALQEAWNKGKSVGGFMPELNEAELVQEVEWWTPERFGYFAGDSTWQNVAVIPREGEEMSENPYGYVPWIRAFSGYGKMPDDGDPASLVVGILTGWEKAIKGEIRMQTIVTTNAAYFAVPPVKIANPNNVELTADDRDLTPGKGLVEHDGIKYELMPVPGVPSAVLTQLEQYHNMFDRFMPGVVQGMREGGEAAISQATRINQANLTWECIYIATKRLIAASLGQALRCVEKVFDGAIEIGGVSLKADDVNGYYEIEVETKPGDPNAVRMDLLTGKQMVGLISNRRILEEYFHVSDATKELVDIQAERLANSPQADQFVFEQATGLATAQMQVNALQKERRKRPASGLPGATSELPTMGQQMPGIGGSPSLGVPAAPEQELTQGMDAQRMRAAQAAQAAMGAMA